MSLSPKYLFLLFLLLAILVPAFLWKATRGYATGAINLSARALNLVLRSARAWALRIFQTLTMCMNNGSTPPGNEDDSSSRWRTLLSESEATIEKYLLPEIDIDLATFIRCVTFRVFLVVFLKVDPNLTPPVFAKVQRVTSAMSEFYNDRQGNGGLPPDVRRILHKWLPHRDFPSSLDRILPAYEALWRIIATIVVTCEDDDTGSLRWMMLDFRDNPRERQYSASLGSDGRSVSTITDDIVGRLPPIAHPQHQATGSEWPLNCIQYATSSRSMVGHPTVPEALRFGALLASKIIGRVGVHYGISGRSNEGPDPASQASPNPWEQRRIFGIHNVPDHLAINVLEMFPHASTSRQTY